MSTGLKNSLDILSSLSSTVSFAVNEQCAQLSECSTYNSFLASNKPVFHIEYPVPLAVNQTTGVYCKGAGTDGMSTILKDMTLDGRTIYCDGSQVDTPTKGGSSPGRPTRSSQPGTPPKTSSTVQRSSTTLRPSTTTRPTSSPAQTTTSQKPTTSAGGGGGGGGCTSKHWDQCGGQNWNGCTKCEVSIHFFSKNSMLIKNSRRIHVKAFLRHIITSVYRECAKRAVGGASCNYFNVYPMRGFRCALHIWCGSRFLCAVM